MYPKWIALLRHLNLFEQQIKHHWKFYLGYVHTDRIFYKFFKYFFLQDPNTNKYCNINFFPNVMIQESWGVSVQVGGSWSWR